MSHFKSKWLEEEQKVFAGWDFSYLKKRWKEAPLSWDYKERIFQYLQPEMKLLDMGTGGGEFLLSLNHPPQNTAITESWEENIQLCKKKLMPLGVQVKQIYSDTEIPYPNATFDIVINRHESFCIEEVERVLKPKGVFITQQVGGQNNNAMSRFMDPSFKPPYISNTLENTIPLMKNFDILFSKEYFPELTFFDVGAFVFFAKVITWEFPHFSVENNINELQELQNEIDKNGFFNTKEHRFIIIGRKK